MRVGRMIKIALGVGLLLAVGSCGWMFFNIFRAMGPVQDRTDAFVERVYAEGVPPVGDPVWSQSIVFPEGFEAQMAGILRRAGPPTRVDRSSCSMSASYGTNQENAMTAECVAKVAYASTEGNVTVNWKKAGGDWEVTAFWLNFDDATEINRLNQPVPRNPRP